METVMEGHGEIYKQLKKMQRAIRHRSVGSVIDFNLAELNASFIPDFHEVGVSCRIAILPHPGQCFKTRVSLYHYLSQLALRSTPADSAEPVFTNKLIPFVNKAFAISQELKEKKKRVLRSVVISHPICSDETGQLLDLMTRNEGCADTQFVHLIKKESAAL